MTPETVHVYIQCPECQTQTSANIEVPVRPMIESKVLEIRDAATRIDALAIRMKGCNPIQDYYFRCCGYPDDGSSIMLMVLYTGKATNDPYEWQALGLGLRTMAVAHDWILKHYAELKDGDVVDVEFILGEKAVQKVSERLRRVISEDEMEALYRAGLR